VIPGAFDYHAPATLEEAIGLLTQHGEGARLLSGGHSLIPLLKTRIARPGILIDIGRIADLSYVREEDGICRIGACTTHYAVESSGVLMKCCPLLPQVAAQIGDVQVRNKGTIGGSLVHGDPAADYPAATVALRATMVATGPKGEREIPVHDFFIESFSTALEPDEILKEIRIPQGSGHCAYRKAAQRASGFAVVGIAVQLAVEEGNCKEAGVGVTGLAEHPFRASGVESALRGQSISERGAQDAAAKVAEGVVPLEDLFASREYRAHLARVHCRRAILAAGLR
jgi:carbon-monoxide dehydrogenase medium subunit